MDIGEVKCMERNGPGELSTTESVYPGSQDSLTQAPTGAGARYNCNGAGLEQEEEIVRERILEMLGEAEEKKLKDYFITQREFRGIPVAKNNVEDLFELWPGQLELLEVLEIIK